MTVKYIGKVDTPALIYGKKYEVISVEKGWYRIMTELDEDYLFPPELFVNIETMEYQSVMMSYDEVIAIMKTGESDLFFEVSGVEYAILIDVDMGVCTYKLSYCGDGIEGSEEFACLDDLLAYKFCGELTFREMWDRGIEIDFL